MAPLGMPCRIRPGLLRRYFLVVCPEQGRRRKPIVCPTLAKDRPDLWAKPFRRSSLNDINAKSRYRPTRGARLDCKIVRMDRFRVLAICAALTATPRLMPAAGDAAKGKEIFEQCGVCHNADSEEKKMGPGLKGLFKREKMTNGKKPTDATVRTKIDEGGNGMPAYKDMLSDQEKDDVIAYLKTL